jgi:hypothetical protein
MVDRAALSSCQPSAFVRDDLDGAFKRHGSESRLTNYGDGDGNRFLRLRPSLEGLSCRVFRDSISVVRGRAVRPTAQESPSMGRAANLTSVPCFKRAPNLC